MHLLLTKNWMASNEIAERRPLRSLNSDVQTFVTFFNYTNRTVKLFWFGFDGKLVNYGKILPKRRYHMNTYVTHPWIAKDSCTAFTLLMNGQTIFFPREQADGIPFEDDNRDCVNIHIPVFSLLQRCVEVVHDYFGKEKLESMELPKELKQTVSNLTGPRYDRRYKDLNEDDFPLDEAESDDYDDFDDTDDDDDDD